MVTVLSRFKATDAQVSDTLRKLLLELKEQSPLEPGCVQYELFATADDPTVFYVKDSWANQPALDRHMQQLQAKGYLDRAMKLLAESLTTVTLIEL